MANRYHHHTYIGSFYDINNFKYLSLGEILYPNGNGFYDLSTVNSLPDYVYENYNNWVDKKYLKEIFERANDFTKHGCKNLIDIGFRKEESGWQIYIHHIVRKPMYITFELFTLSDIDTSVMNLTLTIPSKWIELNYNYTFPLHKNINCPIGPNPLDTRCDKVSLKIYSREVRAYYKYNFSDMFVDTFYSDVERYLFLDQNGIYKPNDRFDLDYNILE